MKGQTKEREVIIHRGGLLGMLFGFMHIPSAHSICVSKLYASGASSYYCNI